MHEQSPVHWNDPPFIPNAPSPTPTLENSGPQSSPSPEVTQTNFRSRPPQDPRVRPATLKKRIRTATDFVRSDFWFNDGNIVIIAGPAAFKVHRGQLERHSEVFLGLFALPQPPTQDQDLVEGCPCVEFHDSPSDVFYFLSALYDGL